MIEKYKSARGRAVLVGVNCPGLKDFDSSDAETMAELRELLHTAGGETVIEVIQNRHTPDPHTFIGEGKAEEIAAVIKDNQIDLVIFDNEISPSQTKALEKALACRVIDRNGLILDIFADRAKTAEGKLQVEMAQYNYLLPRLTRMWTHLVRQTASGGSSPIGTRGPGETQLESDKRHIHRRIKKLDSELLEVRRIRATQRAKRRKSRIPLICLVGYTNAGKSTLLNALTGAGVHAEGRLFDTLDPTTKIMKTRELGEVLISDTVGFIRKLPHHLIHAFKATLEELSFADILVHVVDSSSENWEIHMEVVEKLISELGAEQTPVITVFNKVDMVENDALPRRSEAIYCSAKNCDGIDDLLKAIAEILQQSQKQFDIILPYSAAGVLDTLYKDATVQNVEYLDNGIRVSTICDPSVYGKIAQYAAPVEE